MSGLDKQQVAERVAVAMFARDRASQMLGMKVLAMGPGYAKLSMMVRDDMVNGHDISHGGLIFALADSAFAFACNSYDETTVAAGAAVDFLRPAKTGDELTAEAREMSRSRRSGNGVYDVTVTNQRGELVALFRGRSHRVGGAVSEPDGTSK